MSRGGSRRQFDKKRRDAVAPVAIEVSVRPPICETLVSRLAPLPQNRSAASRT
jgi:hypothetical protein